MTEQEQINALKAKVNCLREALLNTIMYRVGTVNYGDPLEALELTSEQCLNEVRAKAIEDLLVDLLHISPSKPIEFIQKRLADVKREQAK